MLVLMFYVMKKLELTKHIVQKTKEDDKSRLTKPDKDFIALITHDLKNPTLSQMRSINYLLSEKLGPLSASQKEMLEITESSCRYMNDLISLIIESYKYDDGQQNLKLKDFNINDLLAELHRENMSILTTNSQRLVITSSLDTENIYGDRLQIKRGLMNLLTNAIKYSPEGSVIKIQLFSSNKLLTINVINETTYPVPRNLNKLFEKYETVSDYDSIYRGSGLGLYLTKQIVSAHNGKIYAKQLSSKKCLFGFQIPMEKQCLVNS